MSSRAIYLIANGDLRLSANRQCEQAQAAMERLLVAAIEREGRRVRRAHGYDRAIHRQPEARHGGLPPHLADALP
jgi:hypothetical protein